MGMRRVLLLVLLGAVVALLAAAVTNGARGEVTKVKMTLRPCLPLGEEDAGGQARWRSDRQILRVEVWRATDLAGERLDVLVVTGEDVSRIIDYIDFIEIGLDGSGKGAAPLLAERAEPVALEVVEADHTWLASDPRDC
jgi:hypothetical protein